MDVEKEWTIPHNGKGMTIPNLEIMVISMKNHIKQMTIPFALLFHHTIHHLSYIGVFGSGIYTILPTLNNKSVKGRCCS